MDYQMEELLPIVSRLARKYTSGESSSVTYETGQMLMEAVLYCIREFAAYGQEEYALAAGNISAEKAYEEGCRKVIERVGKAKSLYDRMMRNFTDYECENYRSTLRDGMPGFFIRYDARFQPQNHILTLDYPILFTDEKHCGVDRIYSYLQGISMEKQILDLFSERVVRELLQKIDRGYKKHYQGNICEPVVLNMIGCVIADRKVSALELAPEDYEEIEQFFESDSREEIAERLTRIISLIFCNMPDGEQIKEYLLPAVRGWAARIDIARQKKMLHNIFL